MAANDYYSGGDTYNRPNPTNPSPSPYSNNAYNPPTVPSTPAPPYSSRQNSTATRPNQVSPISPFETVFDDHVYPLDQRQTGSSSNSANAQPSQRPANQQPYQQPGMYNQDTTYYGHGRMSPENRAHNTEDIPLQNRPQKDMEMNDHVYESNAAASSERRSKKGKVGFGQLGMFGSDKKRIPLVVYLFSIIQVAVFVGEIVKNGR
jgi:hypothetical protein